jgi:hypothetical protein
VEAPARGDRRPAARFRCRGESRDPVHRWGSRVPQFDVCVR